MRQDDGGDLLPALQLNLARASRPLRGGSAPLATTGFPRAHRKLIAAAALAYLLALLAVDQVVGSSVQVLLGGVTWVALGVAASLLAPRLRMQVAFVVIFATCTEVLGSIVWGVYTYRLGNLPSFVPPGHGLVYIGGMALAAAFARRSGLLTGGALLAVVLWGIVGLTALPRTDVGGAVGCVVLAAVLLLSRNPTYAGVFVVVALLEIFGTAIGTWTWAARVPGIGIENGNPPSGVGSGYVLFDVLATGAAAKLAGALPFGSAGSFGRRAPEARRQPGGGAVLRTISRSCSGSSSAAR